MSRSTQGSSSPGGEMTQLALRAFALLILIPALGVVYLFWEQLEGKWLPLGFLLILSVLGFYLFWTIVRAILSISKGLENISRGEAGAVELKRGPTQLREITEIINALNMLSAEFRGNAAQLERLIGQLTTISEITEVSAHAPRIEELLELVLRKAMESTGARRGSVLLVKEDKKGLDIAAAKGWSPDQAEAIALRDTLCRQVIEGGAPLLVANIEKQEDLDRTNNADCYHSPSFLILPLATDGETIGTVCLSEKLSGDAFTAHDQQLVMVMLGHIGYAVENARLLNQAWDAALQLRRAIEQKDSQLQDAHQKMIQAEKLSALGQLVAGVAHEINNPLTSIGGYTQLLLEKEGELLDEHVRRRIETIHEESNRAKKIVQNLLSFAREKRPESRLADLNAIVRKVVELRQYALKTHGIDLSTDLDSGLPETLLDVDQIQQVLLNLVNNSVQALSDDGPRQIRIRTRAGDNEIRLYVSDTGRGIPQSILDRVFDPFFTTKVGKTNSGLGLSISYGIIKQHGGNISVESREGHGTRMMIRLPVVSVSQARTGENDLEDFLDPAFGNLAALVVDDESRIAELVATFLGLSGMKVTICTLGGEAREELLKQDYDLVVCDVRIPDLDGKQLFLDVCASRPAQASRFVFMTGDVADPETSQFAQDRCIPVIAKPFTRQELFRAVRQAVDAEILVDDERVTA